jgi:hypothetical protein
VTKHRLSEKGERVLRFLYGLRNRKIASALASRGFTKDELEEGFALLKGATTVALSLLPTVAADPQVVTEIDTWENTWFPVVDATLARHYPEVHQKVFLNLSQTEGPAVIISVGTFVDRISALTKAEGGHGPGGKEARKLLARRGLTPQVIAEAEELLEAVKNVEPQPEPPDLETQRETIAQAEQEMWAWYLEWSRIARTVIKDRAMLRQLGFLKNGSGGGGGAPDEIITDGTAPEDERNGHHDGRCAADRDPAELIDRLHAGGAAPPARNSGMASKLSSLGAPGRSLARDRAGCRFGGDRRSDASEPRALQPGLRPRSARVS